MYVISVTKFFESVYPFWNVVPLHGDSLFGHTGVGVAPRSRAALTIALVVVVVVVLRIGAPTMGHFVLLVPLPLCVTLSIRPGGFAFRRTRRHRIFEKIKLGRQLPILECLLFSILDIIIRGSLLKIEGTKSIGVNRVRRTLNNLTSLLNLCLSKFTPPRDSRWKASIAA
jgi:hypothetical protein